MIFSRKGCSCLLLGTLLAVAVGCDDEVTNPPPGPASVRLLPAMATYGVGQTVVVEARIEDATNVGSVAFRLQYDAAVLEYVRGVEGTFMDSDGRPTIFLTGKTAGEELMVGLSRMGGAPGVSGDGLLLTLEFFAEGAGEAGFAISGGTVKDPQAQNLPAVFTSDPVVVVP